MATRRLAIISLVGVCLLFFAAGIQSANAIQALLHNGDYWPEFGKAAIPFFLGLATAVRLSKSIS